MKGQQPNPTTSQNIINTDGGSVIDGDVHTNGGNFAGRDIVNYNWPRIATAAAIIAIIAFTLLIADLAFNLVDQFAGLSATGLWITAGVIGAIAWISSIWVLRAKRGVDEPMDYIDGDKDRPLLKPTPTFTGSYRTIATFTAWAIPILVVTAFTGYYTWRILPAQQTTILIADFVAPSGTDEARVTEIVVAEIRKELTNIDGIQVKCLNHVIELEGGSEKAMEIGQQPQHKATVVIWGNYAIVAGDPELHVHFDIVQPTDISWVADFDSSYGPREIGHMLQLDQPTMFDFKLPLGEYLGQMSAFTIGLTLYEAYRYNEAIPLFEIAGKAIGQPLAADLERAIRFYRGTNYLALNRANDAETDLKALVPDLTEDSVVLDRIALAALGNLGVVAFFQGKYEAARGYHEQALEIHTQLGNPLGQATTLGNLGLVAFDQGEYEAARGYHEQALETHTQLGNPLGQAANLANLGRLYLELEEFDIARDYYEQSAERFRSMGLDVHPAVLKGLAVLDGK